MANLSEHFRPSSLGDVRAWLETVQRANTPADAPLFDSFLQATVLGTTVYPASCGDHAYMDALPADAVVALHDCSAGANNEANSGVVVTGHVYWTAQPATIADVASYVDVVDRFQLPDSTMMTSESVLSIDVDLIVDRAAPHRVKHTPNCEWGTFIGSQCSCTK